MIEKFKDFTILLNEPEENHLVEREQSYVVSRKQKLINMLGSEKVYEEIISSGYTDEFLYESGILDFIMKSVTSIGNSDFGKTVKAETPELIAKTILTSVIKSVITKLQIREYSFLYYFISYGLTTAITELGKDWYNQKDTDFCKAFTKGAVSGLEAYVTVATVNKIAKIFGLTMPSAPFAESIILNLTQIFTKEFVSDTVYNYVCGKNYQGDGLEKESLYDIIKKTVTDSIKELW